MSRKMNFIPHIPDYKWIREQMKEDLKYRLETRNDLTSLGRPLYYRINVQLIMTQECPYHCPFCLERQNPMKGLFDSERQKEALVKVLKEHPTARLSITGGEPSLYPEHLKELIDIYKKYSVGTFISVNTSGYDPSISNLAHINLSVNDYVSPNPELFPGSTIQTVLTDEQMSLDFIKDFIRNSDSPKNHSFSFWYLSGLEKHDYDVSIFNELEKDPEISVSTFRVGDFFVYATFDYQGVHVRITLGDMYQQTHNNYQNGYSNIIIHPDGKIATNWK